MNLYLQDIPASELAPKAIQETPAPGQDLLIARGLQKEQYAGIIGLAIALIAAVGFFSRRVEYAIALAVFLSAIVIALFFI
ncbi:MAG: hypothetical protein RMZ41_027855 [Nostoc sp. DedVER02]|uniref:hypothetical protein n=1 Tax=unclassified Nostoc TaxID=2593658 RepID=UPI002AD56069|nr:MULTISPECIES: hypothetical protein [unclassified Nostoc]MDZ7985046.1 hypothetical protein [Nostoc sp. DedVER02]MDZ8113081.1 hypothetical protein [Nostoc sp. DedVER01b]